MISNDSTRLKWKVPESSENWDFSGVQAASVILSEYIFVEMDGTLDQEFGLQNVKTDNLHQSAK